jgi:hypothetical protein
VAVRVIVECVRKCAHLVQDVLLVPETAEVPSGIFHARKLPATITKAVGTNAFEKLAIRDDGADPRFTREQIIK